METLGVAVGIEKDKTFLILKRSSQESVVGLWEFPAGKVEKKENLEDAARREVLEETGLTLKNLFYVGKFTRPTMDRKKKVTFYLFHSNKFGGKVKLSKEHSGFKWTTRKEILRMKSNREIGIDTVKLFELI
jgi:8-oxo-dGTP pyrophosphatase MutT (NUDIX family)